MVRLKNDNISSWGQAVLTSPTLDDLKKLSPRASGEESDDISTHSQTSVSQSASDDQNSANLPADQHTISTKSSIPSLSGRQYFSKTTKDHLSTQQKDHLSSADRTSALTVRTPSPPATPQTDVPPSTGASALCGSSLLSISPPCSVSIPHLSQSHRSAPHGSSSTTSSMSTPSSPRGQHNKAGLEGRFIIPWADIHASLRQSNDPWVKKHRVARPRLQPWAHVYERMKKEREHAQMELRKQQQEEKRLSSSDSENNNDKNNIRSASVGMGNGLNKVVVAHGNGSGSGSGSQRGSNDVIRYTRERILKFRAHSASLPCPDSVPPQIRIDAEQPREQDCLEFLRANSRRERKHKRVGQKMDRDSREDGDFTAVRPQASDEDSCWRISPPSQSSWSTQCRKKPNDDPEKLFNRRMKSIMNKLTVEKFDKLYAQLLECGFTKKEHVQALMKEVFEKATTQHHFIEMYTTLCMKISDWLEEQHGIDNDESCFKRILLNQCQESFHENLLRPVDVPDQTPEEMFERHCAYKTRMLGNMKFVAHLLINKMLSSRVIFEITAEMIRIKSDETLEALCAFLSCIGSTFDVKEWGRFGEFDKVFQQVEKLSQAKKTTIRTTCLLKDLLDQRERQWAKKQTNAGPTQLAKVREEWMRDNEELDRKRYQQNLRYGRTRSCHDS